MLAPHSGQPPMQLMVLLHGYGSDGNDLIGLGQHWGPVLPQMLFVSPNAPNPCAGNPFGYEWFPLDVDRIAGRIEGAKRARPLVVEFLETLWAETGVTAAETFLVGFSQGAMMALHVGTALEQRLCGVIAFSGAFVPADGFAEGKFAKPPVALIHGELDGVVDPDLSRQALVDLRAAGFEAGLHISKGVAHGISPDGLDFATSFIQAQNG